MDGNDGTAAPNETDEAADRGLGVAVLGIVAGVVMVAGLVLVIVGVTRDPATPPPSLSEQVIGGEVVPLPAIAGCWAVDRERSFAGYRITEKLINIANPREVTARTEAVDGGIVVRRGQVVVGVVAVDLRELRSGDPARDAVLRTAGLETDRYPQAVLSLTEPVSLPAPLVPGEPFSRDVSGNLTLHGVTRSVTLTVQAQLLPERAGEAPSDTGDDDLADLAFEVVVTAPVVLADHDIEAPTAAGVLTVADAGSLEASLHLVPDPATCAAIAARTEERKAAGDGG